MISGGLSLNGHDFEKDVYYQTLKQLDDYLGKGIEDVPQPFSKTSGWGYLRSWWFILFICPLLTTILFIGLWLGGWVSKASPAIASWLSVLAQSAFEGADGDFLAVIWLMKVSQIPLAISGGWLSIGKGRIWRKRLMLILIVILLLILATPPEAVSKPFPSINSTLYVITLAFGNWLLTAASYGLGVHAGRFLSLIAEIWYPFRKVVPAAGGRPVPEVTSYAYALLQDQLEEAEDPETELSYIRSSAQAHLDASETMSLPWGILIAVFSFEFVAGTIPTFVDVVVQVALFVAILAVVLGIFFIAYYAALQVCILQATAQLQRELDGVEQSSSLGGFMPRDSAFGTFLRWLGKNR